MTIIKLIILHIEYRLASFIKSSFLINSLNSRIAQKNKDLTMGVDIKKYFSKNTSYTIKIENGTTQFFYMHNFFDFTLTITSN